MERSDNVRVSDSKNILNGQNYFSAFTWIKVNEYKDYNSIFGKGIDQVGNSDIVKGIGVFIGSTSGLGTGVTADAESGVNACCSIRIKQLRKPTIGCFLE